MKVLILVLSAMRDPWGQMLNVGLETWDKEEHPQTHTMYYIGKHAYPDPCINTDRVFCSAAHDESLEQISARTIEAFEYSLTLEWDFMARTHSSTYVHKRNLVEFCEMLPAENVLAGLLTTGLEPFLWGGGSYIISRDVIKKIVANTEKWNLEVMEDNALTNLARDLDIPFTPGRMASIDELKDGSWLVTKYGEGAGFRFWDWAAVSEIHPHYYFRCKQDHDRTKDLEIFRQLKRHL